MLHRTIVLVLVTTLCATSETAATPRPNVVFILADDLGWNDVGYHGSAIRTPNIDRLAAAGTRLEQFYVQPVCTPTRAALMTGRYPIRYGLQRHVIVVNSRYGLPLEERTLPQALKEAGYRTAITGKWHLGHHDPAYFPRSRGFDQAYGMYWGRIDYFTHEVDQPPHDPGIGLDWHRNGQPLREQGYSTTLIGEQAARWIGEHNPARPLFLYVPFNAPHAPMQARDEDMKDYAEIDNLARRRFAAMVTCMDEAIGRIIDAVEKKGLSDSTLIVFTSDNGGRTTLGANNDPLRGGKNTLYEGGVRVPCVAVWPGQLTPGGVVNAPLHMIDWYPTLLRLAGAPLEQPLPLDGKDIWPTVVESKPSPRDEILINLDGAQGALRRDRWKLVMTAAAPDAKEKAIELFDLTADPNETTNLAQAKPDIVTDLKARLKAYAAESAPPLQVVTGQQRPANYRLPAVIGTEQK
jgi:arylsulfatase A-like enzyme